jgi:hypothetical protein
MKLIWGIVAVFLIVILAAVFYLSGAILAHGEAPAPPAQGAPASPGSH